MISRKKSAFWIIKAFHFTSILREINLKIFRAIISIAFTENLESRKNCKAHLYLKGNLVKYQCFFNSIEEDEVKKKRFGKNPDVDTSFLPDVDRDEEENKLREQLRQEWEDRTAKLKVSFCGNSKNFS